MLSRGISVSTVFPKNNSCNISNPRMPISLARLETSETSDPTRTFLCGHIDARIRVYDCEELMAMKETLGIDGDLKRVFGPKGMILSYDVDGRTRVKEDCLIFS